MFLRRRSRSGRPPREPSLPDDVPEAFLRFRDCLEAVEGAKSSLAAAAPGGRVQGLPLAEALAGFEEGLRRADEGMNAWRKDAVEEAWQRCHAALQASFRRAESLRLGEAPTGYEQLYTVLADLMEPLESFREALERFRDLGLRTSPS